MRTRTFEAVIHPEIEHSQSRALADLRGNAACSHSGENARRKRKLDFVAVCWHISTHTRTADAHVTQAQVGEFPVRRDVARDHAAELVAAEVELLERQRERLEQLQRLAERRSCVRDLFVRFVTAAIGFRGWWYGFRGWWYDG